ncbi:hypothetical protein LIER_27754 [Lithospermum erythrorhizon]|uniref:Phytosulfokine n=1 Tax=Lithospermum erythrorhizon TaxID=34254 RepID=A0AAV3RG60_LITER
MTKHSLTCFILLFCFMVTSCVATRQHFLKEAELMENKHYEGAQVKDIGIEEGCDGLKNNEDCLMRRTLAAHLDYIYTQNKKP